MKALREQEAVKSHCVKLEVKPDLQRRTLDAGDARATISAKHSYKGSGPSMLQAAKWASESFEIKVADAGHGATGFAVCPAGFCSYFGSVFPHYTPFLPSGMAMYILCVITHGKCVICLLILQEVINKSLPWERLGIETVKNYRDLLFKLD